MTESETLPEGDLIFDVAPLKSATATLTVSELEQLLELASYKGYLLSEQTRQYYQTTPDGLLDKTITGYKPNPYHTIREQSTSLLPVQGTGTEEWQGVPPSDLSPELISDIASRLFSVFPSPLSLPERTSP